MITLIAVLLLPICLLFQWFIANYMFQLALEPSETAMVTLLSSSSSFFTLILAAMFPSSCGDKFTFSKCFAVLLSISGAVSVAVTEAEKAKPYGPS